jgi:tellurite resistance protein
VDNYTGAARGLQELEGNIDELRRQIVQDAQRITGNGDLVKYGRGYVSDDLSTNSVYGGVHPGTQIQDLLDPVPFESTTEGTWFHGTKQQFLDRVNFHDGTPHEWGVGLYVTNDADYANVASRAYRTPNNPVPGTTRLEPSGTASVYRVETSADNLLDASAVATQDVRDVYKRSIASTFGKELSKHWDDISRDATNGELMLKVRELYANRKGPRPLETFMQEFSNKVTGELYGRGYRGIEDKTRGIRMIFPDQDGRIPMRLTPIQQGIPADDKMAAMYARHFMDAEIAAAYSKSPVAEAWEAQSKLKLENSMMENMIRSYVPAANDTQRLLDDMLQTERRLEAGTRAEENMRLEDIIRNAPEDALETPEFKQVRDIPPDETCF